MRPSGRQSGLTIFIEQSAIADFQRLGRLAASDPLIRLEHLENYIVFDPAGNLLSNTLQWNFFRLRWLHMREVKWFFLDALCLEHFFAAEYHIARNAILQFADVSRPIAMGKRLQSLLVKSAPLLS